MKSEKETESFRFGDGHELRSQYAFGFEATILGFVSSCDSARFPEIALLCSLSLRVPSLAW